MRKLVEYPTPSLAERDRRWAAVRKEMDARESAYGGARVERYG